MSGDYKYAAQMRAEEIAQEEFGVDFYDLPQAKQCEVYQRGMDDYLDSMCAQADCSRKSALEGA